MPWIKVDDHYDEHAKFAAAGPLGVSLWLAGMAYCNRNLTDGFIPWGIARNLVSWEFLGPYENGSATIYRVGIGHYNEHDEDVEWEETTCLSVIDILIRHGLWVRVDGGYRVHDYGDYQPTKAQVQADRAAKVAAGRAGGIAAAQARAGAPAQAGAQAKFKHVLEQSPSTRSRLSRNSSRCSSKVQAKSKPVPVPVPVPVSPVSVPDALLSVLSRATNGLSTIGERRTKPPLDDETIAKCQAILEDPDAPDWKKDAAKAQLSVMGVTA